MTGRGRDYVERQRLNDESRDRADHFKEEWSGDELDLLLACWGHEPEADVAEVLGRTIEACRQRFYQARVGKRRSVSVKVTNTTTSTVEYRGLMDEPDDCFWSPDYYTNGKGSHA